MIGSGNRKTPSGTSTRAPTTAQNTISVGRHIQGGTSDSLASPTS